MRFTFYPLAVFITSILAQQEPIKLSDSYGFHTRFLTSANLLHSSCQAFDEEFTDIPPPRNSKWSFTACRTEGKKSIPAEAWQETGKVQIAWEPHTHLTRRDLESSGPCWIAQYGVGTPKTGGGPGNCLWRSLGRETERKHVDEILPGDV
jgi:hypothetical protein